MEQKTKATHKIELWIWSQKHFKNHRMADAGYDGVILCKKTGEKRFFHSAGELLATFEDMYASLEKGV